MASDVKTLLSEVAVGRADAAEQLYRQLYRELRVMAAGLLKGERRDHTLQATALVNEAFLRMVRAEDVGAESRGHFLALAARAMRCILCDHARRRRRHKRGGGRGRVPLDESVVAVNEGAGVDLVELDDALGRLRTINPRAVSVVEMRFFGGLGMDEIAAVLSASLTTIEREWRYARAWLADALGAAERVKVADHRDGESAPP